MTDEDSSTEHTTNESDENATGGEDGESYSRESGASVDSTTPDSSVDESSESDSSSEVDLSTETDPSSDSWHDADDASTDPSTESETSDSAIEIETPQAETAASGGAGRSSVVYDTRASVLAAASPSEEATLKRVRAVSTLLDDAFRIPGTNYRIGIDPLLGILPVAGDAIPTALSFYPIVEAYRVGVPNTMLAKMLALVAIDATVGSIPIIGTVFDAVWKANKWNLRMLERHIEQRSTGN